MNDLGLSGENDGRIIFYTKDLSANVRKAADDLVSEAAYGLERWSNTEEFTALSVRERVKCMCHVGLSGMAKMCLP